VIVSFAIGSEKFIAMSGNNFVYRKKNHFSSQQPHALHKNNNYKHYFVDDAKFSPIISVFAT
jgi:hypothetical protein